MKILFVNPPNIRSETSNTKNDFAIKEFIIPNLLSKIKWSEKFFKSLQYFFGLGRGVRYGVRAGSRWPFTMDQPLSDYAPYPFFMGYAASYLKENGFEVNILDAVVEMEHNYQSFLEKIKSDYPDRISYVFGRGLVSAILFKSADSRIVKLLTVPLETATIFAAAICSNVPSKTAIKSNEPLKRE